MGETALPRRGPFRAGDQALLVDRKGRRYLTRLAPGGAFHSHLGALEHERVLGQEEGSRVTTSGGHRLLAVRPTLADLVLKMPRETQVVYPKDMGAILVFADIFPGARVLEAGLGSGALSLALLRAVGERGCVISYELRPELVAPALANISSDGTAPANLTVRVADVYQGIEERDLDRIVLDVPEPWQAIPGAIEALLPGGILLSFLPTVLQVHRLVGVLAESRRFQLVETVEMLLRPWHVSTRSMRPDHRMVAHTGFLVWGRKVAASEATVPEEDTDTIGAGDTTTGGDG